MLKIMVSECAVVINISEIYSYKETWRTRIELILIKVSVRNPFESDKSIDEAIGTVFYYKLYYKLYVQYHHDWVSQNSDFHYQTSKPLFT